MLLQRRCPSSRGVFHSIRSAIAFVDELLALKDVSDDAPTTQFSLKFSLIKGSSRAPVFHVA
jgi:hypothetical protein